MAEKKGDDTRTKSIKTAQDRKDFAIAFYNATNNAIEMVKLQTATTTEDAQEKIVKWRDWFLSEHAKYREEVTEKIGAVVQVGTAKDKLKATKNVAELQKAWLTLTQDERQDPDVYRLCQELKEKYESIV